MVFLDDFIETQHHASYNIYSNHFLFFLFTHLQLELRKKQFHVLLTTIQELQQTLESKKYIWISSNYIDLNSTISFSSDQVLSAAIVELPKFIFVHFIDDEKMDSDDTQESLMDNGD